MAFFGSNSNVVKVTVVGDADHLKKELKGAERDTEKFGKNTSSKLGGSAKAIQAGFAAVAGSAILQVVGNLDEMNLRAEQTTQRFDTVFGDLSGTAREWATQQKSAFGVGQTSMEAMAAATQDLLIPMGFAREEAFGMTKEILTTSNALSEWTGGTLSSSEAQEVLTKALLGERDGLVALGVKISEADVQARLAIKGQKELTGAALEQAKAQATLELITEKSTDALTAYDNRAGSAIATQKELTSRTEDAGESFAALLKPALDSAKEAGVDFLQVLDFVNNSLNQNADATKEATDAGFQFADLMNFSVFGLFDMAAKRLGELNDRIQDYQASTVEASKATEEGAKTAEDADRVLRSKLTPSIEEQTEALEESTKATEDQIKANDEMRASYRKIHDPILTVIGAYEDLEDIESEIAQLEEEQKQDTPAYRKAMLERAGIIGDLRGAFIDLQEKGIDPTGVAARQMLSSLGIPPEVVNDIIAEFRRIEAAIEGRAIDLRVTMPDLNAVHSGNNVYWRSNGRTSFAHGGIVTGETDATIGEGGSNEAVIPLNSQGAKFMADTLLEALGRVGGTGSGGPNIVVHVAGSVITERELAETIRKEFVKVQRRNGTTGIV